MMNLILFYALSSVLILVEALEVHRDEAKIDGIVIDYIKYLRSPLSTCALNISNIK